MIPLSVCIIARDSAKTLAKCLQSVSSLSEDLVVVLDPRTKDNSQEIALQFKSRVYVRVFDDFASQKNFAISKAKHNWILSLDADELLSDSLQAEILNSLPVCDAYKIPRHNLIFGKLIRHTNWDPNGIIRLFDKTKSRWVNPIHEQIETSGKVVDLKNPIIHLNYTSVEEFISRLNTYTSAEAKNIQGISFRLLLSPIYDLFRRFIWHAGFLDGWHGLFLSYLQSIYHLAVIIKVWEKTKS